MEQERDPRVDDQGTANTTQSISRDQLRAGDADRKKVADRLKVAVDEGRLDLDEYDERLTAAYAAKTYGELALLTADLPPPKSAELATTSTMRPADIHDIEIGDHGERYHAYRMHRGWRPWSPWRPWIMVSLITISIWFFSLGHHRFWPGFVIVLWGVMLARTIAFGGWRRPYH
jgi:hypothetical protein